MISSLDNSIHPGKKNQIVDGEFLVMADFSENYTFIIQDAVQGYHWNNDQATVHPFVIYYRDNAASVKSESFVVISEIMKHDSIAVHVFIAKLIDFMKNRFSTVRKIIYVSDGAGSQYKNKYNFANICHHKSDFGIECEWHFHATSHGKCACDAIGGTTKRMTAVASLRRNSDPINTPLKMFEFLNTKTTEISFSYASTTDFEAAQAQLNERYGFVKQIPGTQKFHCFIPESEESMVVKLYSHSPESKSFRIKK